MAEPQHRQQFGNNLEKYAIIFSMCSSFSYVQYFWILSIRYGVVPFLIIYTVMQLILGIPMFLMEYFIGQFSSSSIISMYSVTPALKGTGIVSLFIILLWICIEVHTTGKELVTLAYTFTMPWTHCSNWWNSAQCRMDHIHPENNSFVEEPNYSYGDSYNYDMTDSFEKDERPIDEFFKYILNGMSLNFLWQVMLATLLVWIFVYFLAVSSKRIMGKVAMGSIVFKIGTTIVLVLVGLATTLSHGGEIGLQMYFIPSWYKLFEFTAWQNAASMIMMHQFTGMGILATLGSYNRIHNNCLMDAVIVAVFNVIYPFLTGIAYAAFSGLIAEKLEDSLDNHSHQIDGTMLWGLSIVPGHFLWVFLYVLMKFGSKVIYSVILLETVLTSLNDAYPKHFKNRKIVAIGVCVPLILFSMIFCIGHYDGYLALAYVDYYLLYLANWNNLSWFIFIFVFLYGAGRLVRDIRHFLPRISWAVTWPCYLSWIVIVHIIYAAVNIGISYDYYGNRDYQYPSWTWKLGKFFATSVIWFTIIYAIVYIIRTKGTFLQRLKIGFRPSDDWGPREPSDKQAWEDYSKKRQMRCGCCHPDCCATHNSLTADDVAIPLRVETTSKPEQPPSTSSPNETYPYQPMTINPEQPSANTYEYQPMTVKPEVTTAESGLYPNLVATS